MGVLSSRIHVTWALAAGGTLEDRPRYNKSRCFEPFPFPDASEPQRERIRFLGEQLDAHRKRQQEAHPNLENGITPETIIKSVDMALASIVEADYVTVPLEMADEEAATGDQLRDLIQNLETQMREAAKQFEFEKAAQLRDRIKGLKERAAGS